VVCCCNHTEVVLIGTDLGRIYSDVMLRTQLLFRYSTRVVNIRNACRFPVRQLCSNKDSSSFGEVLKKVKNSYDEHGEKRAADEDSKENKKNSEDTEGNSNPDKKEEPAVDYVKYASNAVSGGRTMLSSFITGVQETWTEMLQGQKESKVRKAVPHAQVYQTKKKVDEDGEEIPEPVYEGPTAIMVGKTQKTAWEQMSERLENSPLIREMLKNSRKFSKQAAGTEAGKKAQKVGESVKDKIHVCANTSCISICRSDSVFDSIGCKGVLGNNSKSFSVQDFWSVGELDRPHRGGHGHL
jgi:hypothetical protein